MSYLDDPRVLFAAERTLLAWQRSAIALMAFGFVMERFGLFLRMATGQPLHPSQRVYTLWLGVALVVMGAIVFVASALQYRRVVRGLDVKEIPRGYWLHLGFWLNLALAVLALALAARLVAGDW